MRVQGSMHVKQKMCQKCNFDSFINIILIIIASKCAINQFKICHTAWLHGRNLNSVYFMMVRLEISGISSGYKVTQHKAINRLKACYVGSKACKKRGKIRLTYVHYPLITYN